MDDKEIDEIILKEIFNEKYKDMAIQELWKNFLDVNEDIDGHLENNSLTDFYESVLETLFISSEINKRAFNEKEQLSTSIKFWQEYERIFGNIEMAKRFGEQITYLQKLVP